MFVCVCGSVHEPPFLRGGLGSSRQSHKFYARKMFCKRVHCWHIDSISSESRERQGLKKIPKIAMES